jgi:hypothetical protein
MTAALNLEAKRPRPASHGSPNPNKVIPLRDPAQAAIPRPGDRPKKGVSSRVTALQNQPAATSPPAANPVVRPLPTAPASPPWLQTLSYAQKGSAVVMTVSLAAMLSIYGWTVQIQNSWGQEYQRLQTLLRQERQLTSSNAALKQKIAETAEDPNALMTLPAPSQMLFLEPLPPRDLLPIEVRQPQGRSSHNAPLGY